MFSPCFVRPGMRAGAFLTQSPDPSVNRRFVLYPDLSSKRNRRGDSANSRIPESNDQSQLPSRNESRSHWLNPVSRNVCLKR
jgi:hypothetical protein